MKCMQADSDGAAEPCTTFRVCRTHYNCSTVNDASPSPRSIGDCSLAAITAATISSQNAGTSIACTTVIQMFRYQVHKY